MSFLAAFKALTAGAKTLRPEEVDASIDRLRNATRRSEADDRSLGAPACKVRVVGDPEIFDSKGRWHHYYGPALLVNLDSRGMVRSLEFVGVGRFGEMDDDYIKEVWQLDLKTRQYKYQNLEDKQGTPGEAISSIMIGDHVNLDEERNFRSGSTSWKSEAAPDARPPKGFLRKFTAQSETFFVDCRSGMFVRGPRYGVLKPVIKEPMKYLKPLFEACSLPHDEWLELAASAIMQSEPIHEGVFPEPDQQMQAVQVAQLVYGLTAGVA